MATSSITKKFALKDEESVKRFIESSKRKPPKMSKKSRQEVEAAFKEGQESLKRLFGH